MSGDIVIRAEGLGKKYLIGHQVERERYTALRDVAARGLRSLCRKTADLARGRALVSGDTVEEFWALENVDFEVRRGEVLGIIGRNGAGKSTLLKILSRITEPSAGRVALDGRVASLLEVGTGFHPELTGRENVFLNGAILGMSRAEIRAKFDAIVAFAGVEKFLDTPVKRYSSGMYVRLAFAVAAHLEPEILLVDEVLAVGDAEFQEKCLRRMEVVSHMGRTVLFVSHNLAAVKALCNKVILLDQGSVACEGIADVVIGNYFDRGITENCWRWLGERRPGNELVRLAEVEMEGAISGVGTRFRPDEAITVKLRYIQYDDMAGFRFGLQLLTPSGEVAFTSSDQNDRGRSRFAAGRYTVTCTIPAELLNCTSYNLRVWAGIPRVSYLIPLTDVGRFVIDGPGIYDAGQEGNWQGVVCPRLPWAVARDWSDAMAS